MRPQCVPSLRRWSTTASARCRRPPATNCAHPCSLTQGEIAAGPYGALD
jgi:hypothetical protein